MKYRSRFLVEMRSGVAEYSQAGKPIPASVLKEWIEWNEAENTALNKNRDYCNIVFSHISEYRF